MAKYGVPRQGIRILSIWNEMKRIHFIVQIKYYSSNSLHAVTLFKILNNVTVYTLLNPWDKIWIMMILPKNQWARAQINPNGRCYHRRIDTCKTEKQVKEAPAVIRWGEPPMLKLAKNVVIGSENTNSESIVERKRVNTFVWEFHGFI